MGQGGGSGMKGECKSKSVRWCRAESQVGVLSFNLRGDGNHRGR